MKILVPFDSSEASKNAVQQALKLAKAHTDSEVTVLSVACYQAPYARDFSYTPVELRDACQTFYKDVMEKISADLRAEGIKANTIIESGDAAEVIINTVKNGNYDKVIMGRRGLGSLAGLILGSVSTKVLANVDVPVTLVK